MAPDERGGYVEGGFNSCRQTGGRGKEASFHAVFDSDIVPTIFQTALLSSVDFVHPHALDC
jgi:hypothetical protein